MNNVAGQPKPYSFNSGKEKIRAYELKPGAVIDVQSTYFIETPKDDKGETVKKGATIACVYQGHDLVNRQYHIKTDKGELKAVSPMEAFYKTKGDAKKIDDAPLASRSRATQHHGLSID